MKRKRTLLYIVNGISGSGGLERVLSIKASCLADQYEYDTHILSLNDKQDIFFYSFSSNITFHNIAVSGHSVRYLLQYRAKVQAVINVVNPDFISVCDDGLKGFFLPDFIATKAKWIYERHASLQLNRQNGFLGRLSARLMRLLSSRFDYFVVLTPANTKEWKGKNVISIPNPLSFKSVRKSNLQSNSVIAVGSHSYNKGYDTLIQIWKEIEERHPSWSLNIYGKIDSDKAYIKMAYDLGLENIYFHEPVLNIDDKFIENSIMVLPSRSEGFGMVLIEAMECGLPCVAFDCPSGPKDIVTDKEDGFLIKDQNHVAFKEALLLLIENSSLRETLAKNAIKNVKRYSVENIIEKWDYLFKSL